MRYAERFVLLTLVLIVFRSPVASAQELPEPSKRIVIKSGTPIKLQFAKTISSLSAHKGDLLEFVVENDVIVDGYTLIRAGQLARGSVVAVKQKRLLGMGGGVRQF